MMFQRLKLLITISMIMRAMVNIVVNTRIKMEELFIGSNAFSLSESKVRWDLKMIMSQINIVPIVI